MTSDPPEKLSELLIVEPSVSQSVRDHILKQTNKQKNGILRENIKVDLWLLHVHICMYTYHIERWRER